MIYKKKSVKYDKLYHSIFITALQEGLEEPRDINAAEWAEEYRFLSSDFSARAGKYTNAPYQVEPLEILSDTKHQKVLIIAPSQSAGKTEMLANAVGYYADIDPCPILLIQPDLEIAKAWSERLMMMFRDTPKLNGIIPTGKHTGVSTLHKPFKGGSLTFVGANSASGLATRPIRVVFPDEIDAYGASAGKEGSPLRLAFTRTVTFPNRKIGCITSPRHENSPSAEYWELSDKRQWYVPCHECGAEQVLEWAQVKWEKDEYDEPIYKSAHYECEHCQTKWNDGQRIKNAAKGYWRATEPANEWVAFQFNFLISPFTLPLSEYVSEWYTAKEDPYALQTFINTKLAQHWKDEATTVSEHGLANRKEDYDQLTIPNDVAYLTLGVDSQKGRFVYQVVGWGEEFEKYVIEYGTIPHDPNTAQVWAGIDKLLDRTFYREDKAELKIKAVAHDAAGGLWYEFVTRESHKRHGHKRAYYPIKGQDRWDYIFPTTVSKTKKRNNIYSIGSSAAKERLFYDIKRELKTNEQNETLPTAGYTHFSNTLEDHYFRSLTAEEKRYKRTNGVRKPYWHHKKHIENEAIDTLGYNYAAFIGANPDMAVEQKRLLKQIGETPKGEETKSEIKSFMNQLNKRRNAV